MRWNALAMVVKANQADGELGGPIASHASAADLSEVGFNHFFRACSEGFGGDLVFFQRRPASAHAPSSRGGSPCLDPHRGVQAEVVDVGAQGSVRCALARRRAPERRHLLPSAGAEDVAVSDGRGLQRAQRARLLAVGIRRAQVGLAHVFDQHTAAREHLHEAGDDGPGTCRPAPASAGGRSSWPRSRSAGLA